MSAASVERLRAEHKLLIGLIAKLEKDEKQPDIELCKTLGQTLIDHIRWEEHDFFPEVEQSLSESELDELQEKTKFIDVARKHSV